MNLNDLLKRLAEKNERYELDTADKCFTAWEHKGRREDWAMDSEEPTSDDCDRLAAELGFVIGVVYKPQMKLWYPVVHHPKKKNSLILSGGRPLLFDTKLLATRAGLSRAIELYLEGK